MAVTLQLVPMWWLCSFIADITLVETSLSWNGKQRLGLVSMNQSTSQPPDRISLVRESWTKGKIQKKTEVSQ